MLVRSSKTVDLAFAAGLVSSTVDTLRDFRSDHTWSQTYKYICNVAVLNDIKESIVESRTRTRRQHPTRLQDSITFESTGHRESLSCSESMKVNVYFPILDCILSEFERRFSNSNLDVMKSLAACSPTSSHFLDSLLLSSLASLYDVNHEQLQNECLLARRTLLFQEGTVLEAYHQLLKLQSAFPTLKTLFQLALTIAVSTAQCERSFSALTRIKTHLRTSMTDQRLADISLLSIKRDVTLGSSFLDDTIHEFEGTDHNRTIVLS